jgi:carbon monoxide dehydrogenase subunit G
VSGDNVTVERYIPAHTSRAWRLLSVPVKGTQTIRQAWQDLRDSDAALHINDLNYGTQITSPLSGAVGNGFDNVSVNNALLKYNGTAWEGATTTNESIGTTEVALATSKAYFLYIRGARNQGITGQLNQTSATTLRTTGALYQGAVTTPTIPANSFAVVGNVYPSRINFTNVSRSGSVDNVFYIWDAKKVQGNSLGFYQTFSGTNNFTCLVNNGSYVINSTGNNKIESGQAFFVHTTGGTGTVTLSEDSKVAGSSSSAFRPATPTGSFVSLTSALHKVSGATSTMADANEVVFSNEYSNTVDVNDALKMGNPGENFAVLRNDKSLAVEGRQLITDKDTIFFKMWNLQRSQYSLQFTGSNLNVPGLLAILQDAHTGTNTVLNMTVPANVNFTVDATAASSAANRFRVVFLQTIGTTLPVNFISISAAKDAAGTKVNWKVAAENGIAQYEVERSANGRSFTKSGTVAASTSSTEKTYSFLDFQPYNGTIFYRVKSIGVAGDVKYSTVVKITAGNIKPVFTISPNPAEGNLVNIQFKNQAAGNYQVRISGINGQVLHSSIANHAGGNSTQVINIAERLASGAYQLEIIAPDKSRQVQSLIVKSTD